MKRTFYACCLAILVIGGLSACSSSNSNSNANSNRSMVNSAMNSTANAVNTVSNTVANMTASGELRAVRIGPRLVRYRLRDIEAYVEAQTDPPPRTAA